MKRALDLFLGIILLVITLPIMILIAFVILLESPGPIIYKSKRIGKNNKIFIMPKFRTMHLNTPEIETSKFNKINKITKIGKFLRRFSLDEIPQIFSILNGNMSFVGPRPALFNQHDLIKKRTKLGIHKLKPGLTGLAQINGRDMISQEKKIFFDNQYLLNRNFFFDIKIILKTVLVVFSQKDVNH